MKNILRREFRPVMDQVHRNAPLAAIEHDNPLQEAAANYNAMKARLEKLEAHCIEVEAENAVVKSERDFYKQQHEDAVAALDRINAYASSLETRMKSAAATLFDGVRESREFAARASTTRRQPEEQPNDGNQSNDIPAFLKNDLEKLAATNTSR